MIFIALFEALLVGAFLLASGLALMSVVFGVRRLSKSDWRDGSILLGSAALLIFSLCCIPHLEHYVMYGIRSKVIFLTRTGDAMAGAALLISFFVRNRAKWCVFAGSLVAMFLMSFAW